MNDRVGRLSWISEFVVRARLDGQLSMSEQAWIGEERLTAEVIALEPNAATLQVYEDTTGLKTGDGVFRSGHPLSVTLGPGLLGNVFDGIQRPLDVLRARSGTTIQRGVRTSPLDTERSWNAPKKAILSQRVTSWE